MTARVYLEIQQGSYEFRIAERIFDVRNKMASISSIFIFEFSYPLGGRGGSSNMEAM